MHDFLRSRLWRWESYTRQDHSWHQLTKSAAETGLQFTVIILLVIAFLGCNGTPTPSGAPPASAPLISVDPTTAGTVTGVVTFKGAAPKLAALDMSQDPACPSGRQPSEAVVTKNGKLANVFVYVKAGLPSGRFPVRSEPAVLDQKGCRYQPHVMGILAGQTFKVLNSDVAQHNVHPMPSNNEQWNESQMPMGQPLTKTFAHPEIMVPIQCNQHPWMRAYVSVMSHPYFAVSGADGAFTISNLPPGEYTLAAVHEKFGEQTMQVRVGAKEKAKADFAFVGEK